LYFSTTTDGTDYYIIRTDPTNLTIYRLSAATFGFIGSGIVDTGAAVGYKGLCFSNNRLFFSYVGQIAGPNYVIKTGSIFVGLGLGTLAGPIILTNTVHPLADYIDTQIVATGLSECYVIFEQSIPQSVPPAVTGTAAQQFYWMKITAADTAPVAGTLHHLIGISSTGAPFTFDSRIFVPIVGFDIENQFRDKTHPQYPYSGYGHVLIELSTHDNVSGSSYETCFPVALWARDNSNANGVSSVTGLAPNIKTKGGFGIDSDRYVATIRAVRLVDRFGQGGRDPSGSIASQPSVNTNIAYGIDIMRIAFDDNKRWQTADLGDVTVIACGLPFAYDGSNAHECGHVFRPEILGLLEGAGASGSFVVGTQPRYKVTYDWEDANGDSWYSDTSYPADLITANVNSSIDIAVRLPVLTAKPMAGSNFTGKLRVSLYRSLPAAPDDFQRIDQKYINTYDTSTVKFTDFGTDTFQGSERAYIVGGETDNSCAPPCICICQHGARLFAISTDDNCLYFTKEKRAQRGIEWSQYQRIKLPQRGMALRAIDSALIVFCEKSIYMLEGQGPDALGNPVDGYSRLSLLSYDQGCSERCSAWRIPQGIIFRGYQGLWMINSSLGLTNIGDPVRDFTDQVVRFVDGSLDTKRARLRLMCFMLDGSYKILNYWYDTMRWSVDTIGSSEGTQFSSTVHQGVYYRALQLGVFQQSDIFYRDGEQFPIYLSSVQTGWLKMGGMHDFKRVWRGLATIGKVRGEYNNPSLDIILTVENEDGICVQKTFSGDLFEVLSDWSIRVHLEKQKGKAFRIRVEETPNDKTYATGGEGGYINTPYGYTFSCLSLEYGVKRGAAKLPAARTK
jgi:hypothetical protein